MHKQNPMHKCKCRNFFFSQATPTRETCAPNYKNSTKCRNEIIPFTSSGKSSNCCIPYQSPCALRHTLQSTISVAICPCKKCNTISWRNALASKPARFSKYNWHIGNWRVCSRNWRSCTVSRALEDGLALLQSQPHSREPGAPEMGHFHLQTLKYWVADASESAWRAPQPKQHPMLSPLAKRLRPVNQMKLSKQKIASCQPKCLDHVRNIENVCGTQLSLRDSERPIR